MFILIRFLQRSIKMEIKNGIAYLGKMKTFRVFFIEGGEITTLKMKEKSEKELRIRLRGIPIHHVEELGESES